MLTSLLGIIYALCFSQEENIFSYIQIITLASVCVLFLQTHRTQETLYKSFIFNFSYLTAGLHWLIFSLHNHAGISLLFSIISIVMLTTVLAIVPTILISRGFSLIRNRSSRNIFSISLIFAASWTLGDWIRGSFFINFPWLITGYGQLNSVLNGYAPFIGVYGIGFITSFISSLIAFNFDLLYKNLNKSKNHQTKNQKSEILSKIFASVLCIVIFMLLGFSLQRIHLTQSIGPPLKIRLIQGNVPQDSKFLDSFLYRSFYLYTKMITAHPADLIITPETSFPVLFSEIPTKIIDKLKHFAQKTNSTILLGAISVDSNLSDHSNTMHIKNTLFTIQPKRTVPHEYNKYHLVPFGEYLPLRSDWLFQRLNIPFNHLTAGNPRQAPIILKKNAVLLPTICYEDIFGEEVAERLQKDLPQANFLINVSNLAWFDNTVALDQHLRITKMRALETKRPIAISTNTGITAIIDIHGKVTAELPRLITGTLDGQLQPMVGSTPYMWWRNWPIILLTLFVFCRINIKYSSHDKKSFVL